MGADPFLTNFSSASARPPSVANVDSTRPTTDQSLALALTPAASVTDFFGHPFQRGGRRPVLIETPRPSVFGWSRIGCGALDPELKDSPTGPRLYSKFAGHGSAVPPLRNVDKLCFGPGLLGYKTTARSRRAGIRRPLRIWRFCAGPSSIGPARLILRSRVWSGGSVNPRCGGFDWFGQPARRGHATGTTPACPGTGEGPPTRLTGCR